MPTHTHAMFASQLPRPASACLYCRVLLPADGIARLCLLPDCAGWTLRTHLSKPACLPRTADTLILVRVVWFAQQDSSNQGFKIAWCTVMVVCQIIYIVSRRHRPRPLRHTPAPLPTLFRRCLLASTDLRVRRCTAAPRPFHAPTATAVWVYSAAAVQMHAQVVVGTCMLCLPAPSPSRCLARLACRRWRS